MVNMVKWSYFSGVYYGSRPEILTYFYQGMGIQSS